MQLTQAAVQRLREDSSVDVRAELVEEIARRFSNDELDPPNQRIAEEIFRVLLNDVEVRVRRAMAEALAGSSALPLDVALALARDVADVAEPVIEASEVLLDKDLIDIINTSGGRATAANENQPARPAEADNEAMERKQRAVARRRTVSQRVCASLVENGSEHVARILAGNPGADITEPIGHRVIDRFGPIEAIQAALIDRPAAAVSIVERLAFIVSDKLRAQLSARHGLPPRVTRDLARLPREKALLDYLGVNTNDQTLDDLASQLHDRRRITGSLLIRALCIGQVRFFQVALARAAGLPVAAVRKVLCRFGSGQLERMLRLAQLPSNCHRPMRIAIEAAADVARRDTIRDRAEFTRAVLNSMAARLPDSAQDLSWRDLGCHDLEYVISRLCAPPQSPAQLPVRKNGHRDRTGPGSIAP